MTEQIAANKAATLADLEAQRAALDAQIEAWKQAEKAESIARVRALMTELGVTQRMLGGGGTGTPNKPAKARHVSAGKKLPPKYRDGNGNSWSGRGLMPKWLREAIAGGASLESFEV